MAPPPTTQPSITMALQSEIALTCKLPSRKDTSFLRFNCPDWSKLDIIGQTVILAELTSHFGSFQNTCTALKIQPNEVESFLLTHLQYQKDRERGSLIAEQWGREQAVPADENEDIPQQRPVFIAPSSIAPACDFLNTMGYHDHVPAVQAWSRKLITWPPQIDVTDLDIPTLNLVDVVFPRPLEQRIHSTRTSCLHNDTRVMIALAGVWKPREDGTPDAHIAFIDIPDGSVAYGPRGTRQLTGAGRYYVCWPTDGLLNNRYNDLVLAKNAFEIQRLSNDRFNTMSHGDSHNVNASDRSTTRDAHLENLNTGEGPLMENTIPADLSANPKDIIGNNMPNAHSIKDEKKGPFHSQTEPQGPSRKLENPQLLQTWGSWPGQIFQFRLPPGYTILGPLGHVLTFDPIQQQRYDDLGDPHGVGGTYLLVPPLKTYIPVSFKMEELPVNVILRFKTPERLVMIRNGMVLPRFVEPGVHEWSTPEGFLDLYGAHGCYEVFRTDGRYSILPDVGENSVEEGAGQEHEHRDEHDDEHNGEDVEHNRDVAPNPSPIEEAMKILAPHRDWLDREEEETIRLEQEAEERARLDTRIARDKARRDILIEERESRKRTLDAREALERARVDTVVRGDTTTAQSVQNRRGSMKQSLESLLDPNLSDLPPPKLQPGYTQQQQKQQRQQPKPPGSDIIVKPSVPAWVKGVQKRGRAAGARRKRATSDEDEDYTPARPRASRAKKPTSRQNTPTPRKPQEKPGIRVRGAGDSQSSPAPESRQTRATSSQARMGKSGLGPASGQTHQLPPGPTGTRPSGATVQRKPIGPLLDAIQDSSRNGDRSLQLLTLPKVNDRETAASTIDGNAAGGATKMALRTRTAKTPTVPDEPYVDDPEKTESEEDF